MYKYGYPIVANRGWLSSSYKEVNAPDRPGAHDVYCGIANFGLVTKPNDPVKSYGSRRRLCTLSTGRFVV